MKAALIHCPGGGSATEEDCARAEALLREHYALTVYIVDEAHSPEALAAQALADGATLLVAQGGDGTTSSVAAALVKTPNASLGIIPAGTANSIATYLGLPKDVDAACAVIIAGHERVLDTAVANGKTMVLLAAVGLHARAIIEADPVRKRDLGALAYVIEGLSQAASLEPFEVELQADGLTLVVRVSAVTIANIAPKTTLLAQGPEKIVGDDGLLDVTLVRFEGLAQAAATALRLATSALTGTEASSENVGSFQARSVSVRALSPQAVMIDGEDAGDGPLEVRCVPQSLRVRVSPTEP